MTTIELAPPDSHHLQAAIGWLELGNPSEAGEEIARISADALEHPDVLSVRWQICASTQSWEAAYEVADLWTRKGLERPEGLIHKAYALRRMKDGGLKAARYVLLVAAELFPNEPMIRYNLACYAAQSGGLEEGWEWLQKAMALGGRRSALKKLALADVDLQPLWDRIRQM